MPDTTMARTVINENTFENDLEWTNDMNFDRILLKFKIKWRIYDRFGFKTDS